MSRFDRAGLVRLVDSVVEELAGDWLLVGGGAVALTVDARRLTEDVDIFGIGAQPNPRFELMSFAERHGLPIEAVNSAADFFVMAVDGWRQHLVLERSGQRGRLFVPDVTLLVLLKVRRLSAVDLNDCLAAIGGAGDGVDLVRLRGAVEAARRDAAAQRLARLDELERAIDGCSR